MRILVHDIQREVATRLQVPLEAMTESDGPGSRNWKRSHPRQLAMCLSYRLTSHGTVRIGHFFGHRDHSTVINGIAAAERRIFSDPETREAARVITKRLLFG